MNDTAQETTTAMATLVEHEVLGASLLPVEVEKRRKKKKKKTDHTTSYINFTEIIINITNIIAPNFLQ